MASFIWSYGGALYTQVCRQKNAPKVMGAATLFTHYRQNQHKALLATRKKAIPSYWILMDCQSFTVELDALF
jgi:hypothetical protein